MYISDYEELAAFCERAKTSRVIAIDTEFLRERTYHPRLCLIQVGTHDETAAIDPLAIEDMSPLVRLLEDTSITKVFHACTQDMEVILSSLGCIATPVFDTQLAAAFLGQRQQIGYGALVEEYCGVRLAKAESLTDWSRRPLDPEQLAYAEDDVRYLPGIYDQMMSSLIKLNRLSWLAPEMGELVDLRHFTRAPEDAYLHLKRSSSLTRKQLAIARELCAWREELASHRNIPRKWVLSDEVVVEACRRTPKDVQRLVRIRGAEQLAQRDAEGAVAAIARGVACNPAHYPTKKRHDRPSADIEGVLDLMYALLRIVSEKSGIATQLIATKDDLLDFIADRTKSRVYTSPWRRELVGDLLSQLLDGEVGLTVKNGKVEVL